jgi:small subunit ribosomal protein S17
MSRRILQGVVVSDAGDKTVVVRVERRVMHAIYKKFITHSKKYAAHDEQNRWHVGDVVRIEESRPISKRKRWVVLGAPDESAGRRANVTEMSNMTEMPGDVEMPSAEAAPEVAGGAA